MVLYGISMHNSPIGTKQFIISNVEVLKQDTNFHFIGLYGNTSSICICSDIKMWASGPFPEVKSNRKIQITSVESGCSHLQEVSTVMN